jgi:hypothetical protein
LSEGARAFAQSWELTCAIEREEEVSDGLHSNPIVLIYIFQHHEPTKAGRGRGLEESEAFSLPTGILRHSRVKDLQERSKTLPDGARSDSQTWQLPSLEDL